MTPSKPLDLLEPGVLLGGALFRSLGDRAVDMQRLAAGTRLGPFRIIDELGHGGMGVVYRAERDDGSYQQQVAIKCVLQDYSETRVALFRRERQILAELKHPHIARLLDGGRDETGRLWLAMELVEGQRIDAHVIERGLDIGARLKLFLQVVEAVEAAHARLLMHRDIKPNNVLVDADGRAKLLDFGIASLIDEATATRAYSPRWASPEQHAGTPIGLASDQYQLALLLDAMLRAAADTADSTQAQPNPTTPAQASINPEQWLELNRTRRAELYAIVVKATAAAAQDRYGSVHEFGADVQRWMDKKPVTARGGGVGYFLLCALRRHPYIAATVVTAVIAALAAAAAFNWRITEERDIAQYERQRADREAAEARAINEFMHEDLLAAANPLNRPPGAPEVTVREALDRADAAVLKRFATQPEIAIDVLTTLGDLHHEFGDFERSVRVLDSALLLAAAHAPDSTAAYRAALQRGAVHITQAQYLKAVALLGKLVNAMAQHPRNADAALHFEARLRLLEARSYADPSAPIEPLETLAKEVEKTLGAPHWLAGEARFILGDSARTRGTPLAAVAAIESAATDLAATLGADHPTTLEAAINVSHLRRAQGRVAEAIDGLRAAYALQVKRYGPDATNSMWMQNELAFLLIGMNQFTEAEPLLIDLIGRREASDGNESLTLIPALSNLANTRLRLGRAAEALPILDRAQRLLAIERTEPAPLPVHLVIARGRADALRELGQLDQARAALDKADMLGAALPRDDIRVLSLQGARARLMIAEGDHERGLALLDQTIMQLRVSVDDQSPALSALLEARARL
jgi:eukaryotic-like serine/threonine-protein kinase